MTTLNKEPDSDVELERESIHRSFEVMHNGQQNDYHLNRIRSNGLFKVSEFKVNEADGWSDDKEGGSGSNEQDGSNGHASKGGSGFESFESLKSERPQKPNADGQSQNQTQKNQNVNRGDAEEIKPDMPRALK